MFNEEKINEFKMIFSDKELLERIVKMEPEDAANVLNKKGFDITIDDLNEIANEINELQNKIGDIGELDEETLSKIAGGGIGDHVACFVLGMVGGVLYYSVNVPW